MKDETLIKVLERSIEMHSTDKLVLRWVSLEIERYRFDFGDPIILHSRNSDIHINGFSNHHDACECAKWIGEELLKYDWKIDFREHKPRNETWYIKEY